MKDITTTKTLCRLLALLLAAPALSCREENEVIMPEIAETGVAVAAEAEAAADYAGMYVLCEGNMGSNKATLDYLDLHTGTYYKNIFPSRNPSLVKELGDVGNDIGIYGSRLWMTVNCSNKVEVCTSDSARSLGHVDIANCRFLCFGGGYAYVSSYVGPVGGSSVLGTVCKVDTLSLRVVDRVTVGYQPEEMAIVGGKLYVANSGGYEALQGRGYDSTVSVVDLATFTEERRINVAPNLFRLRADSHGQLWVSSRGDYSGSHPSRLYVLRNDAQGAMSLADSIDVPVSDMAMRGDSLCFVGTSYDDNWSQRANFGIVDTRTCRLVTTELVKDPSQIETAYGLMVHPVTGHIYVMDATNYVSSGKLFCFDAGGNLLWKTSTGDIPGHACWHVAHKTTETHM